MAAATARKIVATYDKKGVPVYRSVTSPPDNSFALCMMVPDRIIPVIFVPGVMGSNLGVKRAGNKPPVEPVWLLNSDLGMLKEWGNPAAGPAKRKRLLRPEVTDVYNAGDIPEVPSQTKEELKRRGWGEVGFGSYSEWLVWLENTLNDYDNPQDGLRVGLIEQLLDGAIKMDKVTHDEIALTYKYRFPVHAVGYNWLDSNANSAVRLQDKIMEYMKFYTDNKFRCEQVIVVTHSMGGLVARHCAKNLGMEDKILGVVHGVMPAIGAAAVYRRMKAGTESPGGIEGYLGSEVLGGNAAEMTAVLSSAPGPLQLLPSIEYGMNWLTFHDGKNELKDLSLPKKDPYSEIYTVRGKWWSLCEDALIDPRDVEKKNIDSDWNKFALLISQDVKVFLEDEIKGKYHTHTYAFCGIDQDHQAYGQVQWMRRGRVNQAVKGPPLLDYRFEPGSDAGVGSEYLIHAVNYNPAFNHNPSSVPAKQHVVMQISKPEEPGDGTVPRRSGRAVQPHAKAYFEFLGVEHEPAYKNKNSAAQRAALHGIVKIAQRIKEFPNMVYK